MDTTTESPLAEFIAPLSMNGMDGRVLRLPAPKNKQRQMLLVYGQHASIERLAGLALTLNQYGSVTVPDLPGMGGMTSFYAVGQKPTLDAMADYLASFIKLKFRRVPKITIIGMSWGFVITTRMLQRHPDLVKKVDLLVSLVGLVHFEDFRFSSRSFKLLHGTTRLLSLALPARVAQQVFLRSWFLKPLYRSVEHKHAKLKDGSPEQRKQRIAYEVMLWRMNDFRSQMYHTKLMLELDLCAQRVELPLIHVAVPHDRYFDNHVVEQHLNIIYPKVTVMESAILAHAPTVVATAEEAAPFIPDKLRRLLARRPT